MNPYNGTQVTSHFILHENDMFFVHFSLLILALLINTLSWFNELISNKQKVRWSCQSLEDENNGKKENVSR